MGVSPSQLPRSVKRRLQQRQPCIKLLPGRPGLGARIEWQAKRSEGQTYADTALVQSKSKSKSKSKSTARLNTKTGKTEFTIDAGWSLGCRAWNSPADCFDANALAAALTCVWNCGDIA